MTIASTVRFALAMAKAQGRPALAGWADALSDLRLEAIEAAFCAGLPPLLLADLADLPGLIGRAEYCLKTPWQELVAEGALWALISEANHEARKDWL